MDITTASGVESMIAALPDSVTVTLGSDSTSGEVDVVDELAHDGDAASVIGSVRSVLVATGTLSDLAVGSYPTVDGTKYRVRDLRKENDGLETRMFLADYETPT